jgi:hypothetical protein
MIFRNVHGSSTGNGIGGGDLFPMRFSSWMSVYYDITGVTLEDGYVCPGCGVKQYVDNLYGGHIVLDSASAYNSADANVDLTGTTSFFRPQIKTAVNGGWDFDFTGGVIPPDANRVFLLPICTNCNNQRGGTEFKVRSEQKIARLLCYGYTNNYGLYVEAYETDFFIENGINEKQIQYNKFSLLFNVKLQNVLSLWQKNFKALNSYDMNYLISGFLSSVSSSSTASESSDESEASEESGMTTRSGFVYKPR